MVRNTPSAWSERASAETSYEAAMWSEQGQKERFAAVLETLEPQAGEVLLDFGCGTGLFSTWMPHGVVYVGYDWSEGMIARAEHDHPSCRFTSVFPPPRADLVACVGPFNLVDGWSKQQTWDTLTDLWGGCNRALAVCLYSGEHDPDCISYRDSDCITFCKSTGAAWTVERHRSNDLLLVLRR
jgi:SAM-dependent methyltransferase